MRDYRTETSKIIDRFDIKSITEDGNIKDEFSWDRLPQVEGVTYYEHLVLFIGQLMELKPEVIMCGDRAFQALSSHQGLLNGKIQDRRSTKSTKQCVLLINKIIGDMNTIILCSVEQSKLYCQKNGVA